MRLRRMTGSRKLECELTLREGRVVWDLNGIAGRAWEAPEKTDSCTIRMRVTRGATRR